MIIAAHGDILDADVDAVVNTVNTVGVMGKGLALQVKRRYPDNFKAYKRACDAGEVNIGRMFVTESHQISGPRLIINFPTKKHWRADSRLEYIRLGLEDLVRVIRDHNVRSIAIPPLGAGNGGLDWSEVRPLVERSLSAVPDVEVHIFDPVSRHFAVRGAESSHMNNSTALMLSLMLAYAQQRRSLEPWEDAPGASHLEVQKLMYFAARFVPELKLQFTRGVYGPYSDVVRIMLASAEGTFVEGFGDGNGRVLDLAPVRVTPKGLDALKRFRPTKYSTDEFTRAVERVLDMVQGFEGAYPLELLSSVDWAAKDLSTCDESAVADYVRSWTPRKGRMFTEPHIRAALLHLAA